MKVLLKSLPLLGLLFSVSSFAYLESQTAPTCLDGKNPISVDNEEVLNLKTTTKNGYLARAFVQGSLKGKVWMKGSHAHFIMAIGPGAKDEIEIVYNLNFGQFPVVKEGDEFAVCGDFINAFAKNGRYEASPAGAIIHWVHYNPGNRSTEHAHGFIMHESSTLIGFDDAPRGAWNGDVILGTEPAGDRERRATRPQKPEGQRRPTTPPRRQVGQSESEDQLPEICRRVAGRCN